MFVSVRKDASLLQYDVPPSSRRFSITESLKLVRTGPPGWKIYTARGSKFLLNGDADNRSLFRSAVETGSQKNLLGQEHLLDGMLRGRRS